MNKKRRTIISVTVAVIVIIAAIAFSLMMVSIYYAASDHSERGVEITWSEFQARMLDELAPEGTVETNKNKIGEYSNDEQIVNITVDGYTLTGFTPSGQMYWTNAPFAYNSASLQEILNEWENALKEAGIAYALTAH